MKLEEKLVAYGVITTKKETELQINFSGPKDTLNNQKIGFN